MTQLSEHLTAEEATEYLNEFLNRKQLARADLVDGIIKFGAFMYEEGWDCGDDNGYIRASEESKER